MLTSVGFGLLAALANAGQALVSKDLAGRMPARQLIGPLYVANALVLLPLAPFTAWTWSPTIVALHAASVGLMVVTAVSIWDLLDHGPASATTTATALSPIPAAAAGALLIPGTVSAAQVVAAVVISGAVVFALVDAFASLGRRGTVLRVVAAATGTGLLTIATRLIGDAGAGLVETYAVRTAVAAAVLIPIFPPRAVPARAIPRLAGRSLVVTAYFVCVILGAQHGNPVVVQALVATTPLFVLGVEALRTGRSPARRAVLAALVVVLGVAVAVAG